MLHLFMTRTTHHGPGSAVPFDHVLVTPFALFMKGRQKWHRYIFGGILLVAAGTLAALAVLVLGKQ